VKKLYLLFFVLITLFLFTEEGLKPSIGSAPGELPSLHSTQAGDHLQDTYITAIKKAKKSVDLMIYGLKDAKIIQALNDASKKVKVKVIYDADASKGVEELLARKIVKIPRNSTGLMHLKILILDGHDVWLGSANMVRESLKNHANLVTHIDHPEFSKAVVSKCQQLCSGSYEKPLPPQTFKIKKQAIELRFMPDDQTAVDKLKGLIDSSQKTVQVAMYTFTRKDLAECLGKAHSRGVKVEVVIDKGTAKNTSKKIAAYFKRKKIPLFLSDKGGLMHHKFVLIDDKILAHGSANWTANAFKQNDDYIMIITNLSPPQKKVLHAVWSSITNPS
jgi:cardiolipin synthase A/B